MSLSIDLIEFAAEFVETARNCIDEAPGIKRELFTSRKSQAICSMGIACILRQGKPLEIKELVNLAVITTPPEAQSYAEMIALRILLDQPDPSKKIFFEQFETNEINDSSSISNQNQSSIPVHLSQQALLLQEILDFLQLNQSVDVSQDLDSIKFIDEFEKSIFDLNAPSSFRSLKSSALSEQEDQWLHRIQKFTSYQRLGGRSEILNRKISSEESLMELARNSILQSVPYIDDESIIQSHILNMNDQVRELSHESRVHNALDLLSLTEKPDSSQSVALHSLHSEIDTLLNKMSHKEMSDDLELLYKYKNFVDRYDLQEHPKAGNLEDVISHVESFMRENTHTIDDLLRFPELFTDYLDRTLFDKILDQSKMLFDAQEFLQKAKAVDDRLQTNFLRQGIDRFPEFFEELNFEDLLNNPIPSAEWEDLLRNSLNVYFQQTLPKDYDKSSYTEYIQSVDPTSTASTSSVPSNSNVNSSLSQKPASTSLNNQIPSVLTKSPDNYAENYSENSPDWLDQIHLRDKLSITLDKISEPILQDLIHELLQNLNHQMVANSKTREELENSVGFARDNQLEFDPQFVRSKGKQFGMTATEIARLIGSIFEYVKSQLKTSDVNFNELRTYIEKGALSNQELQDLISIAIKMHRTNALGAIAHMKLELVLEQLPNNSEGEELLDQALGAGTGENLLFNWFLSGRYIPSRFRQIIKDHAKRIMIDLAKARAASLIGSSEAGPLPEGTTRPYVLGDELDSIDLDETVENILDTGKSLADITTDDFIVRQEVSGRRCVVFLVDISGSMSGAPLASAALATAMLLFAFSRDELAVALFESNTHVICKIGQSIDLDEVVDEILDLTARGGTQMSRALEWAEKQFELSRSQDRVFIMVTDAMLGDFRQSEKSLEKISDMGVSSALVVPPNMGSFGNIQALVESANAAIIPVEDWKNFPNIVSKILSRV
ncbi:MAG: VWA domain-containing protein [Candidatus Lokiarchaeota archaeon]|nr:VWA domain-containing protein [Candidatus Harpocratesius repetitus]